MEKPFVARAATVIDAPIADVWSALVTPDLIRRPSRAPKSGWFVRTSTRTPLRPHEPNDYIVRYQSGVRRYVEEDESRVGELVDDDGDPSVRVATVEWAVLNLDAAANDREPLFDVVDPDSDEMVWLYETIIRPSGPDEAADLTFEMWGNVLYFRSFDVVAEYDARKVDRSMIDYVLQ